MATAMVTTKIKDTKHRPHIMYLYIYPNNTSSLINILYIGYTCIRYKYSKNKQWGKCTIETSLIFCPFVLVFITIYILIIVVVTRYCNNILYVTRLYLSPLSL